VNVIADTPVSGAGLTLDQIPVPVQQLSAKDLDDSNALDLADAMNRRRNGVYVNENADNPFEPDIRSAGTDVNGP
jgi:hypothetical protein